MTLVRLSLNEIETLTRKAALGAGLPFGTAEELGQAVRWLTERGIDGLPDVVAALDRPGGAQDIAVALATVDGLAATGSLSIADHPLPFSSALLGLAGVLADQLEVDIRFNDGAISCSTADSQVLAQGLTITELRLAPRSSSTLRPTEARTTIPRDIIAKAEALARNTYVPATASSRSRGAGAAGSDND